MTIFNVEQKLVFIAGGSTGLGLAFARQLAARGANIVLLARTQRTLEEARHTVLTEQKSTKQFVDFIVLDLTKPDDVDEALTAYGLIPDVLVCTAGGTSSQIGLFADIKSEHIKSCMESNYYSSAFIAQWCLRRWIASPKPDTARHMVFTSSTAAFVGLPGYIAYTPTKVAVRALADTLRQEVLLYGRRDMYQIHCCFPGTFISDGFLQEHRNKPEITKILEETDLPYEKMVKTLETSESVAQKFLKGLESGSQYLTVDFDGWLLLNNMRGFSPRDNLLDCALGWIGSLSLWLVQRSFDRKTTKWGIEQGLFAL